MPPLLLSVRPALHPPCRSCPAPQSDCGPQSTRPCRGRASSLDCPGPPGASRAGAGTDRTCRHRRAASRDARAHACVFAPRIVSGVVPRLTALQCARMGRRRDRERSGHTHRRDQHSVLRRVVREHTSTSRAARVEQRHVTARGKVVRPQVLVFDVEKDVLLNRKRWPLALQLEHDQARVVAWSRARGHSRGERTIRGAGGQRKHPRAWASNRHTRSSYPRQRGSGPGGLPGSSTGRARGGAFVRQCAWSCPTREWTCPACADTWARRRPWPPRHALTHTARACVGLYSATPDALPL